MIRSVFLLMTGMFLLSACGAALGPGPDGRSGGYRLNNASQGAVQLRMLDGINALRAANGLGDVALNSPLNAAAETHSRDMANQNRAWHFSSDGSSPVERVQRAGYQKAMLGENISETYETELQTLAVWMEHPDTRDVIMNPAAEDLGFAYYQESNGKIWWTLVMGGGGPAVPISPAPPVVTTEQPAPLAEAPPADESSVTG